MLGESTSQRDSNAVRIEYFLYVLDVLDVVQVERKNIGAITKKYRKNPPRQPS